MSVCLAGVDASDRRGGWDPDSDGRRAGLESPIRTLLESHAGTLSAADRLTLVPDTHYPFHPSSGMVTDPAVVAALVDHLERRTSADVAVAGASDDRIAFDRTADYLGYPSILESTDASVVDLTEESQRNRVVSVDGERVSLTVPERLLESTVVVVPTLRPTRNGPVAGGMRTLERFVSSVDESELTALTATRAVEPVLTVLDATTAYGGDPVAADTLLAGPTPQVDALASSLLERSIADDPALENAFGVSVPSISVETPNDGVSVDVDSLRQQLPKGELPPADDMHPAVTAAYRLYATVAGDAVPPQLEQGP